MTSVSIRFSHWIRLAGLALGILVILWLPVEDLNDHKAVLFAAAICTLVATRLFAWLLPRNQSSFLFPVLIGIFAGMAVSPVTVVLMVFKIGLHSHPVPDFTFTQIIAVVLRTPIWVLGGGLIGLGVALLRLARRQP